MPNNCRIPPRVAPVLVASLLMLVSGCGDDSSSPTAPETTPAVVTVTAQALLFRQLSVGGQHTCGVTTDDRAYCWGYDFSGELGDGPNPRPDWKRMCGPWPCSRQPVAVAGGLRFRHVSAGFGHSCGVTLDARVYCWGDNANGQLGDGTTTDHVAPVAVAGGRRFTMVRAGFGQTCAINPYEVAYCWGGNQEGQLGDGTQINRTTPARVAGGLHWHQLTAGGMHTCGVTTDNRAYCWGNNGNGEVGDSSRANVVLRPSAVAGGLLFRQIDAGYAQTCALTTGDRAYCWGFGGLGQLGDGTTHGARLTPRAVAGTLRFDHLSAGGDQTCGVTLAGQAFCWGANYDGEIGDGTTINRLTPTALAVDLPLGQVAAGYGQTCAVTTGDRAYCWGDNIYGQLGDGTIADRYVPVPVLGPL